MHTTPLLLFCTLLSFQPPPEPTLVAPAEAKVYVPVDVTLKDAYATTKLKWKIIPEPAWSEKLPTAVGFRFTGPPAKYQIRVDYVDFKRELWGDSSITVVISGAGPVPPGPIPPQPVPPDPVPPTPVVGPAWAIVVEQTEQRTPTQAAVLNNYAMWQSIEAKGHRWRLFDADSTTAVASGYKAAADKVGLPALLVVSTSGKLIEAVKMPETSTAFEAELKKATGL